jgi:hypothetical protein
MVAANSGGCFATGVALGQPTITYAGCGNLTLTNNAPAQFPAGTNTVTWTAQDQCNNVVTCPQLVIVRDATPPTILCPTNLVLATDAGQCSRSNVTFNVTATDGCGSATVVSIPPSGSTFPVGTTIVTNTAVDGSGNVSLCTFTVTVSYSSSGNLETGLIVLMGIDAEDTDNGATPNKHGPILTWQTLASNILRQATGGSGILVFGGSGTATNDITRYWSALGAFNGQPVTFVNGSNAIATVNISTNYRMIGVASDTTETPSGGLTLAEHNALAKRTNDIANFLNAGRALMGLSSEFTASATSAGPYAYMSSVAGLTLGALDFVNIDPTPTGLALGVNDTLDVSSWHQYFVTYPSFLKILAYVGSTTNPAALGGKVNVPFFSITCPNNFTSPVPSLTVTGQVFNTACQVLTVTWRVNGVAVQTNTITPSSANAFVTLTRTFSYGVSTVSMTASDGVASPACSTTVTVVSNLPPTLTASLAAGPTVNLKLSGTPSTAYVLQSTTNLAAPIQWQSFVTNVTDASGLWQFVVTNVSNPRYKFYRATTP